LHQVGISLYFEVCYLKEGTSIEGEREKVPRMSVLKIQNTAAELKKKIAQ
jgi:hypothetical protein